MEDVIKMITAKQTAMNIIDKTLERSRLCYGVNALAWDRLWLGGDKEQAAFFTALHRERKEMVDALGVAAFTMQQMQMELDELRADKKSSGTSAMALGEKRK